MDAIGGLLDGPRARDAFLLRSTFDPPWSLRIEDEAPLTLVAMVRGSACAVEDDGTVTRLLAGDVAVLRGPGHYTMADRPERAPQIVIGPGQVCRNADGVEVDPATMFGLRDWGNDVDGETVMITGTYEGQSATSRRLLLALPSLLVVGGGTWDSPLVPYFAEEVTRDLPGQEAVLDRLLDLLLIAVLREWFSRPGAEAPGWYRAHGDPVVGPALRLLHHHPAEPWTVAMLADAVGVSRAGLARRFHEVVGEPPMAFLTSWRLALAADLLCEPGATVGSVAPQVGYGSAFALSSAFKRVRGVSPSEHRAAA